jgi:hypothetical protein
MMGGKDKKGSRRRQTGTGLPSDLAVRFLLPGFFPWRVAKRCNHFKGAVIALWL